LLCYNVISCCCNAVVVTKKGNISGPNGSYFSSNTQGKKTIPYPDRRARRLTPLQSLQTASGTHPALCRRVTGASAGGRNLGKNILTLPRIETLIVQPMDLNFVPTRMWINSVYVTSVKTGTVVDPQRYQLPWCTTAVQPAAL